MITSCKHNVRNYTNNKLSGGVALSDWRKSIANHQRVAASSTNISPRSTHQTMILQDRIDNLEQVNFNLEQDNFDLEQDNFDLKNNPSGKDWRRGR